MSDETNWDFALQAKGLVSEYQPKFNSARAVYRERKKYVDDIDLNVLAVPPTGSYKASLLLCAIHTITTSSYIVVGYFINISWQIPF